MTRSAASASVPVGTSGTVRYSGTTSTRRGARVVQPVGERVARLLGPGHQHAAAGHPAGQRLQQALATARSATTSGRMPIARIAAAVPAPIAATSTPASRRASPPMRSSSSAGAFGLVRQTRS